MFGFVRKSCWEMAFLQKKTSFFTLWPTVLKFNYGGEFCLFFPTPTKEILNPGLTCACLE